MAKATVWEYDFKDVVLEHGRKDQADLVRTVLNEMGSVGWEMVSWSQLPVQGSWMCRAMFKRIKEKS